MLVEQKVIEWAKSVTGLPAAIVVPKSRPDEFITVERTGGSASVALDHPQLAVQCWAKTFGRCAKLAQMLRNDAMAGGLLSHEGIYRVDVGSTYSFPDPDSDTPRYQLTLTLTTTTE